MKAQEIAEMILINTKYLKNNVDEGKKFNFHIYNWKSGNVKKTATKEAIHHQIISLRNALLDLDKAISAEHKY